MFQDARQGESCWKAWLEDRVPRDRGSWTQKSRTKVRLMCKPMDIATILPMMRAPLPRNTIFMLKNKREMKMESEMKLERRLNNNNNDGGNHNNNNNSQAQSSPYVHPKKVIWKTKYSISRTTGKRVRRRLSKWHMYQNDDYDNMDLSLSM